MESKTLSTIQKVSKVCRIISKIVFVVSIVGASLCAVGILSVALGWTVAKQLGNINISGIIKANADMSIGAIYVHMVTGLLACGAQIAMAKLCELYFKHELEAGTPFTFDGAKELKNVGIALIAISLGATIVCGIIFGIADQFVEDLGDLNMDLVSAVGTGLICLFFSLVCKHGAEISAEKTLAEKPAEE